MANPELAAAVASRICHDLVSPVGAIVNGVDLLREIGPADMPEAVGMIGQSAGRASALLQFYRIAFGAADDEAQPIGRPALRELASVLAHPPRILLEWHADGPPMPRPVARLAGLMLLCARSVTGMRGAIRLTASPDGSLPLAVTVESDSFAAAVELLDLVETAGPSPTRPVSPRSVEFVLAREAAAALGIPLSAERTPGRVTMSAAVGALV